MRTMPAGGRTREHSIDWGGAALLSLGVSCVLLACAWGGTTYAWDSPRCSAAVVGVLGVLAFLWRETRAPEPLLPLGLFRIRTFAVSSAAAFGIGAVLFGITIYVPVFMQGVLQASATSSGVVLIPLTLGWVVAAFVGGQLISRTGRYKIFPIVGATLVLVGCLLLTTLDEHSSRVAASAALVVIGVGMGAMFQVFVIATQNAVEMADLGVATAAIQFFRSMGASIAVAALGALLTARLPAGVDPNRLTTSAANVPDTARAALADATHPSSSAMSCRWRRCARGWPCLLPEHELRHRSAPEDDRAVSGARLSVRKCVLLPGACPGGRRRRRARGSRAAPPRRNRSEAAPQAAPGGAMGVAGRCLSAAAGERATPRSPRCW